MGKVGKAGKIGVIGGSGLYGMKGLTDVRDVAVETPFGRPSDKYITGVLDGRELVFLPRHGKRHTILPTELNYKANIYGMKKLGVDTIISVSAVGSLKKEIRPLDMVVVDQFVDRTNQARKSTFFGEGIAGHVAFANPVCPRLSKVLYESGKEQGVTMHEGGTYLNIEGPMFSTLAESNLYRSWGMDIIGMTNMPEARLAREAEICYATLAMVTDYDCWYAEEAGEVSVDVIIRNLNKNAGNARGIVARAVTKLANGAGCACRNAARFAIITSKDAIPANIKKDLDIIIGKYL